jgi:adenine-specific DNA-methyltransferase
MKNDRMKGLLWFWKMKYNYIMKNIFEQLKDLLKKDERLVSQDGVLLKNQTQELARKNDLDLIKLLLSDKAIKQHFFFEVEKTLIFDKEKFIRFVSNKQFLPDSYTAFKNKIGLIAGDEYLSETKEVVLVWPYKDCLLEGGMTKEDQKRDEIFYNETLAPDDINRLLDTKVFTNFKRIDKNGEHKLDSFKRDSNGTIKDNLIIKGNNLLALASLKKEFAGKVKLIYIDPPYNTGNDGFKYNDSFNHSSWLVFMKNRLEVAKALLRDDGFIFVQCDDIEQAYLKILLDDIFGRDNYRNSIYWHRTYAGKTISKNLPWNIDTILFYSKNPNSGINNITKELNEIDIASFNKDDNDGKGKYTTVSLQKTGGPGPQTTYDYKDNEGRIWKCPVKGWRMIKEKLKAKENDGRLYITDKTIREKYYLNERLEIGKQIDNLWGDIGNMNRSKSEDTGFSGQKPEKLLQRIFDLTINNSDIVLDFFAGTGTTLAVAHKTGRQYIGIEQMDYIHDLPESRLKEVIKGDQSGISKDVNWKGGGDFVYMELAEWNEKWVKKIRNAKTGKELTKLWDEMKGTAFLSYKVDPKTIDEKAKDFVDLDIADQKKFLIECLDKNQLYVNYSEIEDKEYGVSKEDQKLNKEFYE